MGRGRDPHADIASRVEVGLFTFNKQKKIRNQFFFFGLVQSSKFGPKL